MQKFIKKHGSKIKMKCGYCSSSKHSSKNCSCIADGKENRKKLVCDNCGAKWHHERACPRLNPVMMENPNNLQDYFILD